MEVYAVDVCIEYIEYDKKVIVYFHLTFSFLYLSMDSFF